MKKRIAIVLCMLMLALMLPSNLRAAVADTQSGSCGDDLTWTLTDDGTLTISGTGALNVTYWYPPWETYKDDVSRVVVGDGVTYICGSAFTDLKNLVSAHIGKNVSEIGWNPFAWSPNLKEITVDPNNTSFHVVNGVLFSMDGKELYAYPPQKEGSSYVIPDGVTWIKGNAFNLAKKLNSVSFPDSLTVIDGWSFSQSGLKSVTVPESVTDVYGEAFNGCTSLESVVVDGNNTHLWFDGDGCEGVFENCPNLRSVTIPCSLSPGEHTFRVCYSLEELHLTVGTGEINVDMIHDLLFWYRYSEFYYWNEETQSWEEGELPAAKPLSVILDEGITKIPENTFDTNYFGIDDYDSDSAIASVTIPVSVTWIGKSAFAHCGNLQDVYYGGTSIQKEETLSIFEGNNDLQLAEWHCNNATSGQCGDALYWSLDEETGTLTITGSGAMWDYTLQSQPWGWAYDKITYVVLPDGLTTIGAHAFPYCEQLKSITIPTGVVSIGEGAFYEGYLTSVVIPDTVTTIGSGAFMWCTSLTDLTLGNGVTTIDEFAFYHVGVTTLTLPVSVQSIGKCAFLGVELTDVYYQGTEKQAEALKTHIEADNEPLLNATWHYLESAFEGVVEWNSADVKYKGTTPYVIANGKAQTPRFTVKNTADGSVIDPVNYDYEYRENTKAGTGYVIVTFKGDYAGTCQGVFKIYLPATTATTVANVKDGIKLTWSKVEGAAGYVIYRRAWSSTTNGWTTFERWNNTTDTTYIDGADANHKVYAGSRYQYGVKAYFARRTDPVSGATIGGNVGDNFNLGEVGPLKTTVRITTRVLNSVTAGKKQMTVKWTASSVFTGYQIQYATNGTFTKNAVALKITNPKTAETVIKNLTKGTTYYVRIRSYHEFNGMTYFGEWSNVKSCKVK